MNQTEKRIFFRQHSLFGGLIGLTFIAATSTMLHFGNRFDLLANQRTITLLGAAGIFIGTRTYRNGILNGVIRFGKAFGACMYESAVAILLYGIYIWFLYSSESQLMENYLQMMDETIRLIYKGVPQLDEIRELVRNVMNPALVAFGECVNKIFPATLYSLLIAAILRRKEKI